MDLIKVNVIGAQPLEACVDRRQHVLARETDIVGTWSHLHSALRREHKLIPPAFQPSTHNLFRPARGFKGHWYRINIRGVDEVDPALGGRVHDGEGRFLIALIPKRHRAEADFRDFQSSAAQSLDLHFAFSLASPTSCRLVVVFGCDLWRKAPTSWQLVGQPGSLPGRGYHRPGIPREGVPGSLSHWLGLLRARTVGCAHKWDLGLRSPATQSGNRALRRQPRRGAMFIVTDVDVDFLAPLGAPYS